MKLIDKLFGNAVSESATAIGEAFDKNFTSDEERLQAQNQLTEKVSGIINNLSSIAASTIQVEMNGNWLQRSWRPLIMMAFGFIVVSVYFIFPVVNFWVKSPEVSSFINDFKHETGFWDLLELGMGGYVIGRSLEKISEKVAPAIGKKK